MTYIFDKLQYYERELNLTQASRFLLPMYFKKEYNGLWFFNETFENCYIGDRTHPELGRKIFLLYNYQMSVEYVKFERKIELMSEFRTDYDYGDERQVMYVLEIPEKHLNDVAIFIEGKYSKLSPLLISKILKFWDNKPEMKLMLKNILNGDNYNSKYWEKIKSHYNSTSVDGEYWPRPLMEKEIFNNPSFDKLRK